MKKVITLAVLTLSSQAWMQAADIDKLHDAIEVADVAAVKKALRRMGPLDPKEKKRLLETAEDILDERESHLSLLKSPWDLTKLVAGSVIGTSALFYVRKKWAQAARRAGVSRQSYGRGYSKVTIVGEPEPSERPWLTLGLGLPVAAAGFYSAAKGFTCSAAKARADVARKVLDEIKKAEVVGGENNALLDTVEKA